MAKKKTADLAEARRITLVCDEVTDGKHFAVFPSASLLQLDDVGNEQHCCLLATAEDLGIAEVKIDVFWISVNVYAGGGRRKEIEQKAEGDA